MNDRTVHRKRGGRNAKHLARQLSQVSEAAFIERKIPYYELLDEAGLQLIEDSADTVLEEIGIEFREFPEALELFLAAGADIDGERVRDFEGFPSPLTNGGLNEHNVAGRDVWSDSRAELIAMTPNPQTGPQYSDLSRIAMERARTAREAAEIVGTLIDEHGYSTYGGNSHMFADENEAWVLLNFAGGQGLWIAERLGPDEVRMSYPGYIREIPLDFQQSENYMGSENFISFAVQQGWFDPSAGKAFNVTEVYLNDEARPARGEIEQELRAAAPIDLRAMMNVVRDPRVSKDTTGYGQVAQLHANPRPELNLLWVAPTGSILTSYSEHVALAGLRLGNALLSSIEARTKELYGLRAPQTETMSSLDYQAVVCQ